MNVLHPGLLAAGIAALAIPIIIHLLLRRRRRPIKWAAMRFLLEAYQKQRRKLKLQQWLLLAARCLLVLLIGLALARPLFDRGILSASSDGRTLYLIIDNSIASGVRDEQGTALERHKQSAAKVLGSLGPGDRAALITLAAPAEPMVIPASADPGAVRRLVEGLEPQDSAADLRRALELVGSDAPGETGDARLTSVVILSDFLEGSVDLSAPLPPALAGIEEAHLVAPIPQSDAPVNSQVVSVIPLWDDPSDLRPGQASVRVRRTGASVTDLLSVKVRIWAQQDDESAARGIEMRRLLAEGAVRLARGQIEASKNFPLDRSQLDPADSEQTVLVAEIDSDALVADNQRRSIVPLRESLRVGIVAQRHFGTRTIEDLRAADWFRFALTPVLSTPIEIIDISPAVIDAPQLSRLDAAILTAPHLVQDEGWALLRKFVNRGGLVFLCPPAEANVHLWTESFEQSFDLPIRLAREAMAFEAPLRFTMSSQRPSLFRLLEGELPELIRPVTVARALVPEPTEGGTTQLLELENGAPWMVAMHVGAGKGDAAASEDSGGLVVYMASPPDPSWTNLPLMPLMVPLLQETIRQGVASGSAGVSTVVAGHTFAPPAGVQELSTTRDGERVREGVSQAGSMTLRRAGVWRGTDESGRNTVAIAANPDVDGARTTAVDRDAVRAWLAGATGAGADPVEVVQWLDAEADGDATNSKAASSPFDLPLLLGVLALALMEMALARWASYAGPWRKVGVTAIKAERSS